MRFQIPSINMRIFFTGLLFIFLIPNPSALIPAAFAAAPDFHTGAFLFDGADTLDVIFYSAPIAYDWNGDGKKDLLVGQFYYGLISFYPNIGTDTQPRFDGFEYLTADGNIISLPYS